MDMRRIVFGPEGDRVSGVAAFSLFHSARTQSIGNSDCEDTRTHTPSSSQLQRRSGSFWRPYFELLAKEQAILKGFSRLFSVGLLLKPPIQHVCPPWPMCRRGFSA